MINYSEKDGILTFKVRVVPRASRSEIVGNMMVPCACESQRRQSMALPMKNSFACWLARLACRVARLRSPPGTRLNLKQYAWPDAGPVP